MPGMGHALNKVNRRVRQVLSGAMARSMRWHRRMAVAVQTGDWSRQSSSVSSAITHGSSGGA